jgi:hypothetical protein
MKIDLDVSFSPKANSIISLAPFCCDVGMHLAIDMIDTRMIVNSKLSNNTVKKTLVDPEPYCGTVLTLISNLNWQVVHVQINHTSIADAGLWPIANLGDKVLSSPCDAWTWRAADSWTVSRA